MIRAVARVTISRGTGRGAALGMLRLRPAAGDQDRLRTALRDRLDPQDLDGIISMHLIESDPALSRPLDRNPAFTSPGAGDWFVLIDSTHIEAVAEVMTSRFADAAFEPAMKIPEGSYDLMWDLTKSDIRLLQIPTSGCSKSRHYPHRVIFVAVPHTRDCINFMARRAIKVADRRKMPLWNLRNGSNRGTPNKKNSTNALKNQ
jgi:hypothetical protein